jgi:LysM repeat protein
MRVSRLLNQPLIWMLVLLLWAVTLSACQPEEEPAEPLPTFTKITAIPIQDLMTARPTGTVILDEVTPISNDAAGTPATPPPLPPQTPIAGPTAAPTPVPEPTFYTIEAGDTFVGIAEQFDISIDSLIFANGYNSLSEITLAVGEDLQIPFCEAHQILPGNTLSSIAQLCGLTMDDLIVANIVFLAEVGSLEAVPLGFILAIPQESSAPGDLDCSARSPREQVIEYTPGPGEGPFCLSQKFGISGSAVIQGNADRLISSTYGEVPLLIPPIDGALYVVTVNDITRGVRVSDLVDWYEADAELISDWNGNPISDPLVEGQQLLIAGANLIFGPFQARPLAE